MHRSQNAINLPGIMADPWRNPSPRFGIWAIIRSLQDSREPEACGSGSQSGGPMTSSILVIKNAAQLVTSSSDGRPRRGKDMSELTLLADAALVIKDGTISWVGPPAHLPAIPASAQVIDATAKTVLPGLVDSHTHLVWPVRARRNSNSDCKDELIRRSPPPEEASTPQLLPFGKRARNNSRRRCGRDWSVCFASALPR